jgi:L-ribulokinase
MFAATAAGLHPNVEAAMRVMGQGFDMEYKPRAAVTSTYKRRYERYKALGRFLEKQSTSKHPSEVSAT